MARRVDGKRHTEALEGVPSCCPDSIVHPTRAVHSSLVGRTQEDARARGLTVARFEVLTPYFPGHGSSSERVEWGQYTARDLGTVKKDSRLLSGNPSIGPKPSGGSPCTP